ncbi:MAG: alpha/beta fold hydrolase [Lautropia sp.]
MADDFAFVPGLNNTAAVWSEVIAHLSPGVRAHTFTNPAFRSVDDIARDWLARLPDRFFLCGTSFGGYVACAMLEMAAPRIAGLALVCTSPRGDNEAQLAARRKALATAVESDYVSLVSSQIAMAVHPDRLNDAALLARRTEMLREYGKERYIAHLEAAIARPDRMDVVARYQGPVLVVAAEQDKLFPVDSLRSLAGEIAADIEVIAPSGHLLAMEQPEALAAALAAWHRRVSGEAG